MKIFLFIKFLVIFLFFNYVPVYSKIENNYKFNSKYLSSYFSAIISYKNENNTDALKYFNKSKFLKNTHIPYLKKYILSLIAEGKIDKAIRELKISSGKKNSKFFESYLLLTLDSIKTKNFKKTNIYLKKLSKFKEEGTFELLIYETLKNYAYLFQKKKILKKQVTFGNLSFIIKAFESCYLNNEIQTEAYFINLINNNEIDYSRYKFFYINYLINNNKFDLAKKTTDQIDVISSNLLVSQAKNWIDQKKLIKFKKIFSCEREEDILGEFFYLVASLYSSQDDYEKSNFYLNISNFLNPNFKFNLILLMENYYKNDDYKKSKKILNYFDKNDEEYYWYKLKKQTNIILKEKGEKKSFEFINSKFKEINQPSIKILVDMGNISKSFKNYESSINYYSKALSKITLDSKSYANILYRRGGSYERLGNFKNSDEDLLRSLEINPNDAYVLNYLAYSWLERNYKIDTAIRMLETAQSIEENDPFILDSVGWAYYLVNDLIKAEIFLRKAITLMPDDPVVNDHYADILWKLDRKIQAQYYWKSVLNFQETELEMKKKINIKILKGPTKINS